MEDYSSYVESLGLAPKEGVEGGDMGETEVIAPSFQIPQPYDKDIILQEDEEEGEEVNWSNFKPPHGNKGMQKFGGRPPGSPNGDQGLKAWQEAIVDYQLLNPAAKRKEIAEHVGVTPEWLSRVMNSDAFLRYKGERLKMHQSMLSEEIVTKAGETALMGLSKLHTRISTQSDDVSTHDLVKTTEMAGKMLGLGVANQPSGPVQINNFGVNPALLAAARKSMELVGQQNTNERLALEIINQEDVPDEFIDEDTDGSDNTLLQEEGRKGLDTSE